MSAFAVLGTGATRAAGTALVAGLLVVTGMAPAWASVRTGEPASRLTHSRAPALSTAALSTAALSTAGLGTAGLVTPERARPGGAHGGITVRLPDGRVLHFSSAPAAGGSRGPSAGVPPSGGSAPGSPSGGSSGSPSAQPSGAPSTSAVPLPVVSSLFPSPGASGSPSRHKRFPGGHPSRSAAASGSSVSTSSRSAAPAPVPQGGDAVPPAAEPDRPASTVPPPLGPQAVLQPGALSAQLAAPRTTPVGSTLAYRGRLLGVGLALIGTGAALFGWRIRRL